MVERLDRSVIKRHFEQNFSREYSSSSKAIVYAVSNLEKFYSDQDYFMDVSQEVLKGMAFKEKDS